MILTRQITPLGKAIFQTANSYVTREPICIETSYNRGECVDEIKCKYNGLPYDCTSDKVTDESYCAETVYVWLMEAFAKVSADTSILPKIRTKGALDLLNRTKKTGILVNDVPKEGCVFYRNSSAKGATGHVGVIYCVDYANDRIYTLEGNTSFSWNGKTYDGVWGAYYKISEMKSKGFQFMHFEYWDNNEETISFDFDIKNADSSNAQVIENTGNNTIATLAGITLFLVGGIAFVHYTNKLSRKK